jgi:iron complex outermembrane receptor protein
VLQNAATAEVYGGELEVTVAPHRDFNVRGSVAYTHGTYKSFPAAQVFIPLPTGGNLVTQADVSGNDMARAPRWSFNVAPSWTHDFGAGTLGVNASLYYSDRVYFDFMNSTSQPAYALLNGEISWTTADEKLRVSLWAANLTNKTVIQEIRPGALSTDLRYEMPRRIGLGAEFKF